MPDEELHFPGQVTDEQPTPPEATPEAPVADPAPEAPAPEATPAEEKKPEDAASKPAPADEQPKVIKPRSIYDDLKEERRDRKDWQSTAISAAKAAGIELTGSETLEELQALLAAKETPETPVAPATPEDDDLKSFAEAEGLSEDGLKKLIDVIQKRIVKPDAAIPEGLAFQLEQFTAWQKSHEQAEQRTKEDQEILSAQPTVQKELDISDATELKTVMDEIIKLSHTPEFHDKEVEYIVWKRRAHLSTFVSPKKDSFEQGGSHIQGDGTPAPDFSSGKVTPAQAAAATQGGHKSSLEIRSSQR
jgi:hypothetical protein